MNLNFSHTPDYDLNTSMINEVINMYGVPIKFLIAQKINTDDLVFGDYSHLKTDNNKIYDLFALPENSEGWDQSDNSFNQFGLNNFENINLFVSKMDLMDVVPDLANHTSSVTGNLIVLPNNKVMEISNTSFEVPGVNNLYVNTDAKSVLMLTCIPYNNKLISEVSSTDVSVDPNVPNVALDTYFNELINQTTQQNTNAEVTPSVPVVQKGTGANGTDTVVVQPPVDKTTEPDVWGNFK